MRRLIFVVIAISISLLTSLAPNVLAWELERPSMLFEIGDRAESSFTDGRASVGLGIRISEYYENKEDPPFYGGMAYGFTCLLPQAPEG